FRAEAKQMVVGQLAIDQFDARYPAQADEGKFGGVRHEAEHTFSAKNLIYHKSIQAAHELMFVPGFNTMRLSFSMQLDICLLHFRSYPGSILTFTGSVCAVLN